MKLDALQTKLVTLLTAAFPNDIVVADWCRKETEAQQEAALATRGVSIAVSPMLRAVPVNGDGGKAVALKAYLAVRLRTNPVNNDKPTGAQKEPVLACLDIIAAILADRTGPKRFALGEDGVTFCAENEDAGLLSYDISFTYVVQA